MAQSNSSNRQYVIASTTDASLTCTITGLAVKEKEFVVSTINKGGLAAKIKTKSDAGLSFPTKIGEQIHEDILVTYVTAFEDATLKDITNDQMIFESEVEEED